MNTKVYDYFNNDLFKNFLELLREKYVIYGTCTGVIHITPKTSLEASKLSGFLGLNLKENVKYSVKISFIQEKLNDSIFDGYSVDDLVKLFYPNIKTNKELRDKDSNVLLNKYNMYKDKYFDSNIKSLFINVEAIKKIKFLIKHDDELLNNILLSLNNLPIYNNDIMPLSIFASNMINDPHFYDLDTHNSNILLQFICLLYDLVYDNNRKVKIDILSSVGLVIDSVSNYVITYNLTGNKLLDGFKGMPLNLNLSNINQMNEIKAVNNKLLVVENPSFISMVEGSNINYSVVVTSGNSNLVVYKLIDKLKNSDIYFNGDFDPEGLMIAEKFKKEYPNTHFIGYNSKFYYHALSSNNLSDSRLKKLDNITFEELIIIKELLLKERRASYQETNYELLLDEFENW